MDNILEVENLVKRLPKSDFYLDQISFSVPYGSIMGFVGENGAGKTTTISCILNTLFKDGGSIKIFGKEMTDRDTALREEIGVVFDTANFSGSMTANQLSLIMNELYKQWDKSLFARYLKEFNLSTQQKIKTYSKGMKMKLAIAVALSHNPKLLILDEATSELDPIVRDDMLDVFLDFVQEETHAILLSSHITSDLEKIADYITFIHNGRIILTAKKDDLIYKFAIIRCKTSEFSEIDKNDIIAYRKRDYQIDVLIADRQFMQCKYKNLIMDSVSIDDIMVLLIKGEQA